MFLLFVRRFMSSHKSMISSLLILRWKFFEISITFILTLDLEEDQTQIIRYNLYSSQRRSGQWAELSDVFEAIVEYHSGLRPARILQLFWSNSKNHESNLGCSEYLLHKKEKEIWQHFQKWMIKNTNGKIYY